MVSKPLLTPVTTPPLLTIAKAVLRLAHMPPVVASAKVVVAPLHNVAVPVIAAGADNTGSMVTTLVATNVLQLEVTE